MTIMATKNSVILSRCTVMLRTLDRYELAKMVLKSLIIFKVAWQKRVWCVESIFLDDQPSFKLFDDMQSKQYELEQFLVIWNNPTLSTELELETMKNRFFKDVGWKRELNTQLDSDTKVYHTTFGSSRAFPRTSRAPWI